MNDLTRFALRDLIIDIRCAYRDGQPDYAEKCKAELRRVWSMRHCCAVKNGRIVPLTVRGEIEPR